METASILFTQVMTMFLLILVGFICYKAKIISRLANKQLSNLVLTFVNSSIILNTFQTEYSDTLAKNLGICFILSCISLIVGVLASNLIKFGAKNNTSLATERYAIIYPNSGYMGIPLLLAVFDQTGALYASTFIVAFNLFVWTQGVMMLTGRSDKKLLLTAITSPVIICIVIGLGMFLLQIKFPSPLASAIGYLSSLQTPLAMLVAGGFIAQTSLIKAFTDSRVYINGAIRLLLVPLIMLLILKFLPIENEVRMAILILSASPSATNTMLFASRFGGDVERACSLFSVSTLLSIITIPLVTMLSGIVW